MKRRIFKSGLLVILLCLPFISWSMTLTSDAFENGAVIPAKYTCMGENISPPLTWTAIPENTKALALVMEDPDAPSGIWDHWILYNIPPARTSLSEGINTHNSGMHQGKNSWGKHAYDGPCPPKGIHRYYFTLYALDTNVEIPRKATKNLLLNRIKGHIIASCELMGRFSKN